MSAPKIADCTPESIQAAKQAQAKERAEITRKTGVRFTEDGRVMTPWMLAEGEDHGLSIANFLSAAIYGKRTH